jgi:hypothetical protein
MVDPEPASAPVMPPVTAPTVQLKLLGTEAERLIFALVPLQVVAVPGVKTTGAGLTVTVIVLATPVHVPVAEVGVTRYSTVPGNVLLGLIRTWLMVAPELPLAPVMPPVIGPTVQEKLLGTEAVSAIFEPVPRQMVAVFAEVKTGEGLTVTVRVKGTPGHELTVEAGVIIYATVPADVLPGLVNTWFIDDPEPGLAPVIPPVIVPTVQLKLPGTLEARAIFGLVPLQVLAVGELVTIGEGRTVTNIVYGIPEHEPVVAVGVTRYVTVPAATLPGLVST